jgi:hypothetical protein
MLDKQARLGRPLRITKPYANVTRGGGGAGATGLAEATSGPAFATTAGLLAAAMQPELATSGDMLDYNAPGLFSRFNQWLRQG